MAEWLVLTKHAKNWPIFFLSLCPIWCLNKGLNICIFSPFWATSRLFSSLNVPSPLLSTTTQGIVAGPSGPHSQLCLDLGVERNEPRNRGVTGPWRVLHSGVLHGLGCAIPPSLRAWELWVARDNPESHALVVSFPDILQNLSLSWSHVRVRKIKTWIL